MDVGAEWLIDALGCSGDSLADADVLQRVCQDVIDELGLHVVGNGLWHRFPPPGGMTALFLLRESHLSLHTYPEHGIATFNLYCCRPRRRWNWEERLAILLGATQVVVRRVTRGSAAMAPDEITEAIPAFHQEPAR